MRVWHPNCLSSTQLYVKTAVRGSSQPPERGSKPRHVGPMCMLVISSTNAQAEALFLQNPQCSTTSVFSMMISSRAHRISCTRVCEPAAFHLYDKIRDAKCPSVKVPHWLQLEIQAKFSFERLLCSLLHAPAMVGDLISFDQAQTTTVRRRVGESSCASHPTCSATTFDDTPVTPSAPSSMGQTFSQGNGVYVHLNQQTYFTGDTVTGIILLNVIKPFPCNTILLKVREWTRAGLLLNCEA